MGCCPRKPRALTRTGLLNADNDANDWLTYHRGYRSWHYGALDHSNTKTVRNLRLAWIHQAGRSTRGL